MKYKKTAIRILLILNIFAYVFISPVISQVSFPDSILLTLKKEHPRLLVNSLNDFQEIKNRSITDDFLKQSIKNILTNADTIVNQPEITEMQKQYSLEQMKKGKYQQSPLELVWYKPREVRSSNLTFDNYYRQVEVASLRSKWQDNNSWFVAFKAGDNGVNNGHLDIGNYDLKDDQDVDAKTKFVDFKSTPDKAYGIMDITDAYKGKALSVKRGIALINLKSVLVQDEIVSDKKMDLYWFVLTPAKITLSDKRIAFLELNGKKLMAEIASPKNAVFENQWRI